MRKARPVIIVGAALCLPVFLFTYGLMFAGAAKSWPWWGTMLAVVSHATVVIGASALRDRQAEHRQM